MRNTEKEEFTIVFGFRHLAVALFMVVVLMGTFAAVSYVVGRVVVPTPAAAVEPAPQEDILVVEATEGSSAPAVPANSEKREPSRARPVPVEMPSFESYFREPEPGQVFLQVAAADRAVAEVFAEYLVRRQFTPQIASGPDERSFRVLVGPIQDNAQLAKLRTGLAEAGFHPFLRRYNKSANSRD